MRSQNIEPTKRQKKIASLIKQDISDILIREGAGLVQGSLVTVTDVNMTPDLALARIYISVFPFANAEQALKTLRENTPMIRGELGKRVKNQLRIVPELMLLLDDSLERIEHIEKLIKQ